MTKTPQPAIYALRPRLRAAIDGVGYEFRSVQDLSEAVREACATVGVTPQVEFYDQFWKGGVSVICAIELVAPDGSSVSGRGASSFTFTQPGVTPRLQVRACAEAFKSALQDALPSEDEDEGAEDVPPAPQR